jgi:membrane-associated HD superfamily phosphohydrolase
MNLRILYTVFLIAQYSFTTGDLLHLIHYMADYDNLLVVISICFSLIGVEILVFSPNMVRKVSVKYRKRVQLIIHILLGINSIAWMYIDDKTISKFILFIGAFVFNMIVIHKILHSIHEEKIQV